MMKYFLFRMEVNPLRCYVEVFERNRTLFLDPQIRAQTDLVQSLQTMAIK